ncbi:hypothetical protein SteCoe_15798 [Stentor coeruleus]|uniref:Uncharacterized protein n=1 Tax=Stentor coeruleus TaxID=5963 RepID=A0A1R2C2S0_9CILI|nr:hypothetical protein SteCoe_15798 [Stentor coeruleus]
MLPMCRNKDQIGALHHKKSRQPLFNCKTGIKTLKHYNSCFHRKILSRKDASLGPTTYISSVKIQELTKTLQAYYSLSYFPESNNPPLQVKKQEVTADINDSEVNKMKKNKCEGFCGKVYHPSNLNSIVMENEKKQLCPNCIEQIMFGGS